MSTRKTGVPVVLSGFGPVGQAFTHHLRHRGDDIARRYGVSIRVGAIRTGAAQHTTRAGEPIPPRSRWDPLQSLVETLDTTGARVLVQAIPSSRELAAFAAAEACTALHRGVHVVTATKSHLLDHWRELESAAQDGGTMIRISGATGAALPAGDLARVGLRGLGCASFRACPNGTVTYVLDRLTDGRSLEQAVMNAQRRGIAEADPSADLSGTDSAIKARLLAALLWDWDPKSVEVRTQPVDAGTARMAAAAALSGRRLRSVASACVDRPRVVTVRLEEVEPTDPLHALVGPEKAVVFGCPDAGDVVVSGGRSSPLGAALAMVKDTIDVTAAPSGYC